MNAFALGIEIERHDTLYSVYVTVLKRSQYSGAGVSDPAFQSADVSDVAFISDGHGPTSSRSRYDSDAPNAQNFSEVLLHLDRQLL